MRVADPWLAGPADGPGDTGWDVSDIPGPLSRVLHGWSDDGTGGVCTAGDIGWLDRPTRERDLSGLPGRVPIGATDIDGDGDGRPDTVVVESGDSLALFTDLDGDGLADQEIGWGAVPVEPDPGPWWGALGDVVDAALGR